MTQLRSIQKKTLTINSQPKNHGTNDITTLFCNESSNVLSLRTKEHTRHQEFSNNQATQLLTCQNARQAILLKMHKPSVKDLTRRCLKLSTLKCMGQSVTP